MSKSKKAGEGWFGSEIAYMLFWSAIALAVAGVVIGTVIANFIKPGA